MIPMKFSSRKALVVGVAALGGVMLCASTAFAGPPAASVVHASGSARGQVKDVGIATVTLVNSTPYEWTLDAASNQGGPGYPWGPGTVAPQQTLEPNEQEIITTPYSDGTFIPMYVQYNFTDVDGGGHIAAFQSGTSTGDWAGGVVINAADGNDSGSVPSGVFHINRDNQQSSLVLQAILNAPATLTVDATAHPAQAQAIMKQFASAQPNTQQFSPHMVTQADGTKVPDITYSLSDPQNITGEVVNETSRAVNVASTHEVDQSQSTSLGVTVGVEANISILDLVNSSAALKVSVSKTWGETTGTSQSASIVLNPLNDPRGNTAGWITRSSATATITGDFAFTSAEGIQYTVNNVTVTEEQVDGATKPNGDAAQSVYSQLWATNN